MMPIRLGVAIVFAVMAKAQVAVVIPDPATMVKDLEAHQARMDEVRENFTYHEITQTDEVDKKGRTTSSTTDEHEVFFVNGHRIRRVVKKKGAPLSARDDKDEQERIRKLVEKQMKAPRGSGGRGRDSRVSIGELLDVMKISNPRRLSLNNRDTLAYDFTGDRKARAQGMNQNAARKLAGTVWIDERDRQVARVEVRFEDDFRIGGGLLVNVQKGTSLILEQAPVGQGLWMPAGSELHLAARAFLLNSVRQNWHIKDFDYQRFDTSTHHVISPPATP